METRKITPEVPLYIIGVDGRLIPCRLVEVTGETSATVRISRSVHGYRRGEVVEMGKRYLCPAESVRRRKFSTAIVNRAPWSF